MKVAIFTLPLNYNYGGILQGYALFTFLKKKGHDVYFIERYYNPYIILKKKVKQIIAEPRSFFSDVRKKNVVNNFCKEFLDHRIRCTSERDLNKIKNLGFELFIVGSDQVWRKSYYSEWKMNFFFDFLEGDGVRKISYAASFGSESWDYNDEETFKLKTLLSDFYSVSVREFTAIDFCKIKLGIKAEQHIDPTLLLSQDYYFSLAEQHHRQNLLEKQKNILIYILDDDFDKNAICKNIEAYCKMPTVKIFLNEKYRYSTVFPSVRNWIGLFIDADFVITDSFHGCVFSIMFNKPFVAIGNKQRGITRFNSLLSLFGLEKRLVVDIDEFNIGILEDEIDWNYVNKRLEEERNRSKRFFEKVFNEK
jgi:hypothetical protein